MPSDKNTVLVVEDSRSFAASVEAAIRGAYSYDVVLAHSFGELERVYEEHRDEIFVAITDLNLPDAEDGAAVKHLVEFDVPCVAFTGNYSANLRQNVLNLGVADYVLKKGQQDIDYVVRTVHRLRSNQGFKVLVVDDAESSRSYLKSLLEKQCFQVFVAESGEEALQLMEEVEDFRILLIDFVMEKMDGFELLTHVRKRYDTTQMAIIGLSGLASTEQVAKFMKYGGNDFLLKPFEHEQVCCRVNSNAQLLDQFDHLARLNEQKNELLGMAAHDIRGPLGVVMSAAAMLKREVASEQGNMLVNLAIEAADDMEDLLNSLLDMSAIESALISIKPEKIDLSSLVEKVVRDMKLIADSKQQELLVQLPVDVVWVEVDQKRIQEVLMNLLSNAIKYSPVGQDVEINLSCNHANARIQVIDKGAGVPKEEQGLLFKPFAKISTNPTGGESSTGLGLAICQRIMSQHNGKIVYKENLQGGSVFEIVMPHQ